MVVLSDESVPNSGMFRNTLRSFDAEGELRFETTLPVEFQIGLEVVVDPQSGDAIVSGGSGTGNSPKRAWVGRYDAEGNERWTREFDTDGADFAHALTLDAAGNLYVAGDTSGAFPGHINSESANRYDIFVLKLDADGELQWSQQLVHPGDQKVRHLSVSEDGQQLIVVGTTGEPLFDDETPYRPNETRGFVMGVCAPDLPG